MRRLRVALFYHSIASDWNNGHAHFLRGIARELVVRGHEVTVWEPGDAWSAQRLVAEHGVRMLDTWVSMYPELADVRRPYDLATLDLDAALDGAALVLVHEWNPHTLVRRIGEHRARAGGRAQGGYRLLFHDTHHRSVTDRRAMAEYDLRHFDGVLAFGEAIRQVYLREGWANDVWTWHEAADIRLFRPMPGEERAGDLVWVGNWGDEERSAELHEFLLDPVRDLKLRATVHGVRYPTHARAALEHAGIRYAGWLPNTGAPRAFARHRVTVHVPRRPYAEALPGIPTIRPFEALASGIPLVSAPWEDLEGLFTPGEDYLVAATGRAMRTHLRDVLHDDALARSLSEHGRHTILARHTCAHRVGELLAIAGADPVTGTASDTTAAFSA